MAVKFRAAPLLAFSLLMAADAAVAQQIAPVPAARPRAQPASPAATPVPAIATLQDLLKRGFNVVAAMPTTAIDRPATGLWLQKGPALYVCPLVGGMEGRTMGDVQFRIQTAGNACTALH